MNNNDDEVGIKEKNLRKGKENGDEDREGDDEKGPKHCSGPR